MNLEIFNDLINNAKKSDFVKNFINELNNFLEKNNNTNKYSKYWDYQNSMEYNVAATIGISRWSADVRYRDELSKIVDESILKLSESEGTLYRKQFMPNGQTDKPTYSIDKYENGEIEHLILTEDKVPKGFKNEDIIFQYKADGSKKVRRDLKEKVVEFASESAEHLKIKENQIISEYKQEGHIYKAIEDDGYIFLKDLTEKREHILEDIDFIVDCYQGEGKYKVINGEYKKVN